MSYFKLKRPKAVPVFLGLLLAALARMVWFWQLHRQVLDPIGMTAVTIAALALLYLSIFHSQENS